MAVIMAVKEQTKGTKISSSDVDKEKYKFYFSASTSILALTIAAEMFGCEFEFDGTEQIPYIVADINYYNSLCALFSHFN